MDWGVDAWRGIKKRRKRGMVQFGGTWRLRERFVYLEEWLETRARPSHPPIGRFLLVKYKPRAGAWCNELNQREGLILAFIVCVSSVNGGMAPGEMEIIFATEYGFRMCSPFRLGSRGERRSSQKFSFPNPTAKTSHLGPRRVRRTELF